MRTCAPMATGISPPLSIMRPALISRSASLPIASISAGVGGRGGCEDVTIYMKRIENSCWGEPRPPGLAELSRSIGRRMSPGKIDMRREKNQRITICLITDLPNRLLPVGPTPADIDPDRVIL